jgi:hypothetical protein
MKEALKGTVLPKEEIDGGRQDRLRYYQSHNAPNKGVPHSQEKRDKIRASALKAGVGSGIKEGHSAKRPERR